MFRAKDLIDNLTMPAVIAAALAGLDIDIINDKCELEVDEDTLSEKDATALANLGKCLAMTQAAMASQQLDCMLAQGFTREEAVLIIANQPLKAGG